MFPDPKNFETFEAWESECLKTFDDTVMKQKELLKGVLAAAGVLLFVKGASGSATSKSFLGRSDLPRGMRNNNPGNLRLTNIPWQGKIPNSQNKDGSFEQFINYIYGTRAMIKDVQSKISQGNNTIRKIIYKYAPPFENNTTAYINDVASWSGINADTVLNVNDKAKLEKIIRAMAKKENMIASNPITHDPITLRDFNAAWSAL